MKTYRRITQKFSSLSTTFNLSLISYLNYTLELCNEIIYRLLHRIEEMCHKNHDNLVWRLYFFENSSRLISIWTFDTIIWRPSYVKLLLIVDITNLRVKQSKLFYCLRLNNFLFENLYLKKEDFNEKDEFVVFE